MPLDPKMVAKLALLGIKIIDLANPKELHKTIAEALDEEYELDRREYGKNKEWHND